MAISWMASPPNKPLHGITCFVTPLAVAESRDKAARPVSGGVIWALARTTRI